MFRLLDLPHVLDLGDGERTTGDLIRYDELRIEHDEGDVEISVYNRAILPFRTDSEAARWIHQVCCRLDDRAQLMTRDVETT